MAGERRDENIDPDVDLADARQAAETRPREWDLLLAIAAGGVVGAESRYGLGLLVGRHPGAFPLGTLAVNVLGCLLIGALTATLAATDRSPRLARPFLGVGVLGGFTTFSTFAVDTVGLLHAGSVLLAGVYVVSTVVLCALAVWLTHGATAHVARRSTRA